jgi:hypothetical protein
MSSSLEPKHVGAIGVSKALHDVKASLVAAGGDLEQVLHNRVSGFVRDIRSSLETSICRIAFVGQIKAGKSSLINALINKPGFLPTDINPSTAVVTKVFLGGSQQNENTALFHFFTESEWDNIMSRGGEPAAQSPALPKLPSSRGKLDELQRRAEKRLGPNFSKVLGKHHLFSAVTPQVLEQYVSAADYKPATPESPVLYSDVTKMAEVFLKGPPFSHPTVMIDTPGVNDLFFIRDEITHSNLADADIYIVVLSAQNPLSSADLSLLRLLRGLQRDKIIAVINRIDSLAGIAEGSKEVEAFVRARLKQEFPHASIPVLLASAMWANAALNFSQAEADRICDARFERYVRQRGIRGISDPPGDLRTPATLLTASGIPRIVDFISRFITSSVSEEQLLPAAATLGAIAHNTSMSSRLALRALAPDKLVNNPRPVVKEELRRQAELSLDQLSGVVREIEAHLQGVLEEWEKREAEDIQNLERYIYYSIDVFADTQAKAFFVQKDTQTFSVNFSKDALRFRSELSDEFALHCAQITKGLLDKRSEAETILRNTLQAKLPNLDNLVQFGLTSRRVRPLSVMALAKATALETKEFWDLFKQRQQGDDAKGTEELKLLIASEFVLILREMLDTARSDLKLTANEIMTRLRIIALSSIFPLVDRLSYLAEAFLKSYDLGTSKPLIGFDFLQDFQSRIKSDLQRQQEIAERLVAIKKASLQIPAG